eukprot:1157566-Pelagomonas_calceolata.AAC.7
MAVCKALIPAAGMPCCTAYYASMSVPQHNYRSHREGNKSKGLDRRPQTEYGEGDAQLSGPVCPFFLN